jgi:hypothetical protein
MQVVTVTCDRDKKQQRLQSHSFDLFITNPIVHWIVIESSEWDAEQWTDYLSPFYTRHVLRVVVLPMRKATPAHWGWIRQQILKLKIGNLVETNSYIIFDSKNFAFKPIDLNKWSIEEGNGIVTDTHLQDDHWIGWLKHCEQFTSIPMPADYWSPITPFVFKTDIVRKLLDTIDVEEIFFTHDTSSQSEFMLYRFFTETSPSPGNYGSLAFWSESVLPDRGTIEHLYNTSTGWFTSYHKHLLARFDHNLVHLIEYMVNRGLDRDILFDGMISMIRPTKIK